MKTKILSPSPENIKVAAQALKDGEIVGMPTETVYGLAGNALDTGALAKIFDAKKRPTFDPLIVHVSRETPLDSLIDETKLEPQAREVLGKLTSAFWPGPLTLVLPKKPSVPDLATAGLPSVALRMPRHPVAIELLKAVGLPLAAPSANRFGRISPTTANHVLEELKGKIEIILDGGPCEIGVESTVVELRGDASLGLLRPGGISQGEIEKLLGRIFTKAVSTPLNSAMPAPGMLTSHYAPTHPFFLLGEKISQESPEKGLEKVLENHPGHLGVLLFSGNASKAERSLSLKLGLPVIARSLSESGNSLEAAKNLFAYMRELDQSGATVIVAEPTTDSEGIGHAIMDRLKRAAAK